jgi:hypothetical protein
MSAIGDHFICPIFRTVMEEPVMVECPAKHRFDKSAIEQWFKTSNKCPVCKQAVVSKRVTPDSLLKQIIESWKKTEGSTPNSLSGRATPVPKQPPLKKKVERVASQSRQNIATYDASRQGSYVYSYPPPVHVYIQCGPPVPRSNSNHSLLDRIEAALAQTEASVERLSRKVQTIVSADRG